MLSAFPSASSVASSASASLFTPTTVIASSLLQSSLFPHRSEFLSSSFHHSISTSTSTSPLRANEFTRSISIFHRSSRRGFHSFSSFPSSSVSRLGSACCLCCIASRGRVRSIHSAITTTEFSTPITDKSADQTSKHHETAPAAAEIDQTTQIHTHSTQLESAETDKSQTEAIQQDPISSSSPSTSSSSSSPPPTATTFSSFPLSPALVHLISTNLHFTYPTPSQMEAIPPILQGRSTLIQAQTGTGKTLAFLIPAIQLISEKVREREEKKRQGKGQGERKVIAMCVVPTRELAIQHYHLALKLLTPSPSSPSPSLPSISISLLISDDSDSSSSSDTSSLLHSCPDFIIGTPKRINSIFFPQLTKGRHRDRQKGEGEEEEERERRRGEGRRRKEEEEDEKEEEEEEEEDENDEAPTSLLSRRLSYYPIPPLPLTPASSLLSSLSLLVLDEIDLLLSPLSKYSPPSLIRLRSLHPKPSHALMIELKRLNLGLQLVGASATMNARVRDCVYHAGWKNEVPVRAVVRGAVGLLGTGIGNRNKKGGIGTMMPKKIQHLYCIVPTLPSLSSSAALNSSSSSLFSDATVDTPDEIEVLLEKLKKIVIRSPEEAEEEGKEEGKKERGRTERERGEKGKERWREKKKSKEIHLTKDNLDEKEQRRIERLKSAIERIKQERLLHQHQLLRSSEATDSILLDKIRSLVVLVKLWKCEKILVVVPNHARIEEMVKTMKEFGMDAVPIHEFMMKQRKIEEESRSSSASSSPPPLPSCLLSTEVSIRGLDYPSLTHLFLLSISDSHSNSSSTSSTSHSYLHVSGRVGRMGKEGKVVNIVMEEELWMLKKTEKECGIKWKKVEWEKEGMQGIEGQGKEKEEEEKEKKEEEGEEKEKEKKRQEGEGEVKGEIELELDPEEAEAERSKARAKALSSATANLFWEVEDARLEGVSKEKRRSVSGGRGEEQEKEKEKVKKGWGTRGRWEEDEGEERRRGKRGRGRERETASGLQTNEPFRLYKPNPFKGFKHKNASSV